MVRDTEDSEGLSLKSATPSRAFSALSSKHAPATFIATGFVSSTPSSKVSREYGGIPKEVPGITDYIHECNKTGVIPVSYFMRHVKEESLVMRYRGLGPLGAKAIARPLEMNTFIHRLDLTGNSIESRGALHIARSLRDNVSITNLSLAENDIQSYGACAIIEMLRDNKTIKELDLSDNGLSDSDGRIFYILLKHNHTLKNLVLRNNSLGENTAEWLQEAFTHNDTLISLDLGWNHFRSRGVNTIIDIIAENSSLQELHMSMNGLGMDGACGMAEALLQNSTLEVLDISANRINTEGAFEIAKALEINQTLKVLKIGNNPVAHEGALTVITAIDKNKGSPMTLLHMEAIVVCDDFELLEKKLAEERGLKVIHGGVIGGRRILKARALLKKRSVLKNLEAKYLSDPMTKLRDYCEKRQIRLVDLFRVFDRDQSWTLTREELMEGVKSCGIEMTAKDIDSLLGLLDLDHDGVLDYQEVALGDAENKKEKLRIAKINQEISQQESQFGPELRTLQS